MVELLFFVLFLAGVVALGMYKAPLWLWFVAMAFAAIVWPSGLIGFLLWLTAVVVGLLAVPAVRRVVLIKPAFKFVKGLLPKVSDTEFRRWRRGPSALTRSFSPERPTGTSSDRSPPSC